MDVCVFVCESLHVGVCVACGIQRAQHIHGSVTYVCPTSLSTRAPPTGRRHELPLSAPVHHTTPCVILPRRGDLELVLWPFNEYCYIRLVRPCRSHEFTFCFSVEIGQSSFNLSTCGQTTSSLDQSVSYEALLVAMGRGDRQMVHAITKYFLEAPSIPFPVSKDSFPDWFYVTNHLERPVIQHGEWIKTADFKV